MVSNPPRNGEGDHDAKRRGGGGLRQGIPLARPPSTMLRMVPLPVPGRIILPLLLLAACSNNPAGNSATPQDLESAAIERGLVRDPADTDVTGLYARDTDRVCVIAKGNAYRIGAFVDYGDGLSCTGAGTATRAGEALSVQLKDGNGITCAFDARFDGDRITFPANLPPECARFCGQRASFAALDVDRLSESAAEARALRSAEGTRLCGD